MRIGQYLVDDAGAGNGGKPGGAVRAQHNQVGPLRPALVEQFLGSIAHHGPDSKIDFVPQTGRHQRGQFRRNLADGAASENLVAFLRREDVLQDQMGVELGGQLGGKLRHHAAGLVRVHRAEDRVDGAVAIGVLRHLRADHVHRHTGVAQHGLGRRAHQQLADGPGSVRAHDDLVDLLLAQVGENLLGGCTGANHDLAVQAEIAGALGERFKALFFGAGAGVIAATDSEALRRLRVGTVVGVKNDQI